MVIILRLQKSDFDQTIRSPLTLPSRGFPLNPRINTHYKEGSKDVYGTDMECIAVDLAGTDFYRPKGMTDRIRSASPFSSSSGSGSWGYIENGIERG